MQREPKPDMKVGTAWACPAEGCSKQFARQDHARRHYQSAHEKSTPYSCPECPKSFARSDLLKRHVSTIHSVDSPSRIRRPRTKNACTNCASRKLRCDGEKPCERCRLSNRECIYKQHLGTSSGPSEQLGQQDLSSSDEEKGAGIGNDSDDGDGYSSSEEETEEDTAAKRDWRLEEEAYETTEIREDQQMSVAGSTFSRHYQVSSEAPAFNSASNVHPQHLGKELGNFAFRPGLVFNNAPYTLQSQLVSAEHITMPLLSDTAAFSQQGHGSQDETYTAWPPDTNSLDTSQPVGKGSSIYRESGEWLSPVLNEWHCVNGEPDELFRERLISFVRLCPGMDKMHYNATKIPPTQVLNQLLNSGISQPVSGVDSWIHKATFTLESSRFVLACCIISFAAVRNLQRDCQVFGHLLHKAVRTYIASNLRTFDQYSRNSDTIQTTLLSLQVELWSGEQHSHFYENSLNIAVEAFRSAHLLSHNQNLHAGTIANNYSNTNLEQNWRDFVEQETHKRSEIHLFIHQAQASMTHLTQPKILISEMHTLLPLSSKAWRAKTPAEWNGFFLDPRRRDNAPIPSVADCIGDISRLVRVAHLVDVQLSALAVLHGYWELLRQYQALRLLSPSANTQYPSFSTSSASIYEAHEGHVAQLLGKFQVYILNKLDPKGSAHKLLNFYHNLLNMYLNGRLPLIQNYLDRSRPQASAKASEDLKSWFHSAEARKATRLAALLLSKGASMVHETIRDFVAVAINHAALMLWTYGVMLNDNEAQGNLNQPYESFSGSDSTLLVDLDANHEEILQRYISLGVGTGTICDYRRLASTSPSGKLGESNERSGAAQICINDPRSVMESCISLMESNYVPLGEGMSMPLSVQTLTRFMRNMMVATKPR